MTLPEAGLAGTQLSQEPVLSGKGRLPGMVGCLEDQAVLGAPEVPGAGGKQLNAGQQQSLTTRLRDAWHPADALGPVNKKGVSFAFLNTGTLMPVLSVICWAERMSVYRCLHPS